jgi:hypothetical protein
MGTRDEILLGFSSRGSGASRPPRGQRKKYKNVELSIKFYGVQNNEHPATFGYLEHFRFPTSTIPDAPQKDYYQ